MADVNLISSDGLTFSLSPEAAELSPVIMEKLANNGNEVVVDNHNSNTLNNVVMFLTQLIIGDETSKKKMKRQFLFASLTRLGELFETALAAHDLGIQVLEDLMCERIAHKIENRPPEQVREAFESDTDLTAEQVAFTKVRYRWAFEGVARDAAQVTPGDGPVSASAPTPGEGSASAPAPPPSE